MTRTMDNDDENWEWIAVEQEGEIAARDGVPYAACPYPAGSRLHEVWCIGWARESEWMAVGEGARAHDDGHTVEACPHADWRAEFWREGWRAQAELSRRPAPEQY